MRTALIFPGQGSQTTGMGRSVAEASRDAMDLWKLAEKTSGLDLRSIYWESGDADLMADTRFLQPALTVTCITVWHAAMPYAVKAGFEPYCAAGHSLGEYGALVAAGALRADEAVELTSLRGALMADADPKGRGGMAAVLKLSAEAVEEAVAEAKKDLGDEREVLLTANFNTPAQYVVSGTRNALEALEPHIKDRKGRMIRLAVSGAFHSPLMEEAAKKLTARIERAAWSTPRIPVYPNAAAQAVGDRETLRHYLSVQMTSPVRWIETVGNQWRDGARAWLEPGPKGVLSRMVKPNLEYAGADSEQTEACPIYSVDSMERIDELSNITQNR